MDSNTRVGDSYEKVLCADCMSLQEYEIKVEKAVRTVNQRDYEFNKRYAVCKKCGARVMVPGLEDENEATFEFIFRNINGYIQVNEIQDIIEKYNVEKRPLSKLLGMGEHTIEKYLEGQLPNKNYSDLLRKVRSNYRLMTYYFNLNKSKLTQKAIEKIEERLEYYRAINEYSTSIEEYAIYILNSKYEITNLSLQKLLYYIEAFGQIMLGERLFQSRCEAWKLGPVYREIYEKYKIFGREQIVIDKIDTNDILSKRHRDIADYVLKHFGIFNGVTLKDLTHSEEPWINAHSGYADEEICEEEISHEAITDYFVKIDNIYNLKEDKGVKAYIESLGVI